MQDEGYFVGMDYDQECIDDEFRETDTDGSGTISKEEMLAFMKKNWFSSD